ncbi:MAG: GreA/GreB family elongation factor [Caldilineaceae bacterium]
MTDEAARHPPDKVLLGTRVTLDLVNSHGEAETMTVDLVDEANADIDAGRLGLNTPLARALVGRPAGGEVAYVMGDIRRVRICALSWAPASPEAEGAAEARRAAVEEARRRAVKTLSENVATSMNNKWGSYEVPDAE